MSETGKRCERCRFWGAGGADGAGAGLCRRFPPGTATSTAYAKGPTANNFPVTLAADWCGEFQPVPDAPREVRT